MAINKTTGVVIARFQTPFLTPVHKYLLDYVQSVNTDLLIILGCSPTKVTNKNPLSFEIRRDMVRKEYGNVAIESIMDQSSDLVWSKNLDLILDRYPKPRLYGGRDSFIPHYLGKYQVTQVEEIPDISASNLRGELKKYDVFLNDMHFRCGIIHAIEDKFPTVYSTVDVGVIKYSVENPPEILLGRKPNMETWCLIGGFVDTTDPSFESAAHRELREEVGRIETHEFKYVGSYKIDDWRYRGTNDSIMTTLFLTYFMGGNPIGGDDLAEVEFHTFDEAKKVIGKHHLHLLEQIILKHNKNEKESNNRY